MKLKVNWKELMKQIWAAVRPVLLGAIGGGIVSFASGCSSLTPSDKTQTMGVYAFGIPGIAVITQSTQAADNAGSDTNAAAQSNPVEVSGKERMRGKEMGGATSSLPVWRRIGQRGRCPSRYGGKTPHDQNQNAP